MTLRYRNMKELRKSISPDVEIVDTWEPTEITQELIKASGKANRTFLEDTFLGNWETLGGPTLTREYRFHDTRKWRFDFAHLPSKTAFEIMGGLYSAQSGHRSTEGVRRDYEKSNAAQALGWKVYSLTSKDLENGETMRKLVALLLGKAVDDGE